MPGRASFVERGLLWAGVHVAGWRRPSGPAPSLPTPEPLESGLAIARVQRFTDARLLADASTGRAPTIASARPCLHRALECLWRLRVDLGATWVLREPLAWAPRELNSAAEALAAHPGPGGLSRWCRPTEASDTSCVIAFLDGASSDDGQGWAAFVATRQGAAWSILVAEAWRGPLGVRSVPALEGEGIACAARLLAWIFDRSISQPPALDMARAPLDIAERHLRQAWPVTWPPRR